MTRFVTRFLWWLADGSGPGALLAVALASLVLWIERGDWSFVALGLWFLFGAAWTLWRLR